MMEDDSGDDDGSLWRTVMMIEVDNDDDDGLW